MYIEALLVNSFTSNGRGGNPAAVVLNADKLSNVQKSHIAQTVGYSETAFVSKDEEFDFNVSFFTTTGEIDFCGHATLAAFSVMHQKEVIGSGRYAQRTKAGVLYVSISDGQVTMEQPLPQQYGRLSAQELSEAIGIDSLILESTELPIEIVSTGLPDIFIPVPKGYLDLLEPNKSLIAECCKKHSVIGFHVFEVNTIDAPYTASCRNFAPLVGICEESATGSSSGALACYLTEHLYLNKTSYVFEQGRAMGRASIINASVELSGSTITKVIVGGIATFIGTLEIPV